MEIYDQFMSIQRASMILGVSRTHVYRLILRNVLIGVEIGDKQMVKKETVERYLQLRNEYIRLKEEMNRPISA